MRTAINNPSTPLRANSIQAFLLVTFDGNRRNSTRTDTVQRPAKRAVMAATGHDTLNQTSAPRIARQSTTPKTITLVILHFTFVAVL
jgi:hypothetical protein